MVLNGGLYAWSFDILYCDTPKHWFVNSNRFQIRIVEGFPSDCERFNEVINNIYVSY
jgi:hypothetical protein